MGFCLRFEEMTLLLELFYYDVWATQQLVSFCQQQSPAVLEEIVVGTDRSILRTLTHLIGSEQAYLAQLAGEAFLPPVRQGQILSLAEIQERCERCMRKWEEVVNRIDEIDITLPGDESWPEIPHGQNVIVLQALQHGIDHRTQICTTISLLGLEPPRMDGWSFGAARHQP
jgi:uncharacterized damage-inducible protein DinB